MPANPFDSLKALHRKIFVKGQEAVAQEVAAERLEDQQVLTRRAGQVAAETIDFADELAADGNPHKQRLAALIKDSVVGAVEEHVATGRHEAKEERGAIVADPFLGGSPPLETSLPGSLAKALPHESTEPPKRGRGRPPKHAKG